MIILQKQQQSYSLIIDDIFCVKLFNVTGALQDITLDLVLSGWYLEGVKGGHETTTGTRTRLRSYSEYAYVGLEFPFLCRLCLFSQWELRT